VRRFVGVGLAVLDAACIAAGLAAAWAFWLWHAPNLQLAVQVPFRALWLPNVWLPSGAVVIVAWILALRQLGMHDPGRLNNSATIAGAVTRSTVFMGIFVVLENFLLGERLYPRGLVVPFLGASWLTLLAARLLTFRALLRLEQPPTAANALIIGVDEDGVGMAERMARDARLVCAVAGHVRSGDEERTLVAEDQVLGDVSDIPRLVNERDIQVLVVATRRLPREDAMRLAVQADRMGLRVLQAPYSWGVVSPRLGFARIGGLDLIDLVGIQYPTLGEQVKRTFDLAAVLTGGIFLAPLLVVVALLVKLQDGGPVFYVSPRLGRGGRKFDFLKFRSMVPNADRIRPDELNESDGRLFKMKRDPRITPLGARLRRWSIDELPQLINVLRGDMNLVGPRPLPERDLAGIEDDTEMAYWFEQRSKVCPGITGLWQVSGRSETSFAEMVRLDIHYIQEWTVWLDVQILLKTVPAVLRGRGAR
jgi:exopolysaccharide biosynthesis polyprenyl glycosylphosphotransferase